LTGRSSRSLRLGLALLCAGQVFAGPPYLTDDPEPVDLHHWEIFLFAQGQTSAGARSGIFPAVEANYGPFRNAQIQVQVPMAYADGSDGRLRHGLGDLQVGFKYRFLEEESAGVQVSAYPQIQVPTGREEEGLGGGHYRIFLPVWLQKSFGAWSVCGGGGWWRNPGADERDFAVGGLLVQRQFGETAFLGLEVFHQQASSTEAPASTAWNVGGGITLSPHLQAIASGGRTFSGPSGSQFYVGLRGTL